MSLATLILGGFAAALLLVVAVGVLMSFRDPNKK